MGSTRGSYLLRVGGSKQASGAQLKVKKHVATQGDGNVSRNKNRTEHNEKGVKGVKNSEARLGALDTGPARLLIGLDGGGEDDS